MRDDEWKCARLITGSMSTSCTGLGDIKAKSFIFYLGGVKNNPAALNRN